MDTNNLNQNDAARDTAAQMEEISKKLDRIIDIMEAVHVRQAVQQPLPVQQQMPLQQPVQQPVPQQVPVQQQAPVQQRPVPQPTPVQQAPVQQPQPRVIPGRVVLQPLVQKPQEAPQPAASQQKAAPGFAQKLQKPFAVRPTPAGNPVREAMERNNLEFRIGANLLAIIGVLFVIVALVTFGITMLPDMVQGVFLYLIFIGLILVSELFVRKRLEKFSVVLTSLGLIGLYASTIVNYLFTHLLNSPLAIAATVLISAFAALFSRKRDSFLMRLILHLGVIACFFPYHGAMDQGYFATIAVLIFAINLTAALLPVTTKRLAADLVQVISMCLFTIPFTAIAAQDTAFIICVLPMLFSIAIGQVILLLQKEENITRLIAVYSCHTFTLLAFFFMMVMERGDADITFAKELVYTLLFSLPFVMTLIRNFIKKSGFLWVDVFALHVMWLLFAYITRPAYNDWFALIPVLLCYASATFAYMKKRYEWQHLVVLFAGMLFFFGATEAYLWIPYAALIFASLFVLHSHKTVTVAAFSAFSVIAFLSAAAAFPKSYDLFDTPAMRVAFCALLLALVSILANLLPKLKDEYTRFFNYAVTVLIIIFHTAVIGDNNWPEYLMLLTSGLIVTLFLLKEQYGFKNINRYLILVIYLTFMIFMVDVELPVIISIALMVLSIASVILGSVIKQKSVRVYGLGLALLTCAKIAMYDFAESGDVSRIAVFLISGLLAIAISFIYIRLEKKGAKEEGSQKNENVIK
ncbi:MAG: DUF2339 domain-containing protein [Lachnospiraceae bacterium]|nr:DUF2339 domain-containing protein [Lachnospiraceae bacterium]